VGTYHDNLKTYWSGKVNTAYTAGQIEEPDKWEALMLLDRWITAEIARDNFAATDIQSYSIADRSVTRKQQNQAVASAVSAKRNFMSKLYGDVTYADLRSMEDAIDEVG